MQKLGVRNKNIKCQKYSAGWAASVEGKAELMFQIKALAPFLSLVLSSISNILSFDGTQTLDSTHDYNVQSSAYYLMNKNF